jgi:hypothetical protein
MTPGFSCQSRSWRRWVPQDAKPVPTGPLDLAGRDLANAETRPTPQPAGPAPQTARYTVVFDSTWNATSHPVDFRTPHTTPGLMAALRRLSPSGGKLAVSIRRMAERGSKQPLDDEVNRAIGRAPRSTAVWPALARTPLSRAWIRHLSGIPARDARHHGSAESTGLPAFRSHSSRTANG